MNDRLLSALGLAKKAGKLVVGANLVSTLVRSDKKPCLVLLALDASPNTKKVIESACRHHGVPCRTVPYSMDALSHAIGASYYISCVAVSDAGFARMISERMNGEEKKIVSQGV